MTLYLFKIKSIHFQLSSEKNQIRMSSRKITQLESAHAILPHQILRLRDENESLNKELKETKTMLAKHQNDSLNRMQETQRMASLKKQLFRYDNIKNNDKMILFYTGLSKSLFGFLLKYGPKKIV